MIHRKNKLLLVVTSVVLTTCIAGYFSLPFFFTNIIKLEIRTIIKESTHGKASYAGINLSSFNDLPYLSIALDTVVVKDSINSKLDTLFTAKQIAFSISLKDWLFDHKYVVRKISFLEPNIFAKKYKNGQDNFSFLVDEDTSKAVKTDTTKFNFKVNSITIQNGLVRFQDFKHKTLVVSEKINIKGSMDISNTSQNLIINMDTKDFVFKYAGITYLYKNDISADMILDYNSFDNSITFNDHAIQVDNFKFGFIGFTRQRNDTTEVDLQFSTSDSEVKNLMSLIPGIYRQEYDKYKASGEFSLTAEVKGFINPKKNLSPSYFAHFTLKNGSFQYNYLPKPISDISLDLKLEKLANNPEPTITLNKFYAKLDSNYVSGVMTVVGLQKPLVTGNLNTIVELHELDSYFKIDSLEMGGHLLCNMSVNGVYDLETSMFPKMNGQLLLSKGYFKREGIDHAFENVEMETNLSNNTGFIENTALKLSKLNLNIGDEYVEMYGKMEDFKKYNFDLFLKSDIDLSKMSQILRLNNQTFTGTVTTKIIAKGSADKFKEAYINGTAVLKDVHILDRESDLDLRVKKGNVVFSPEMVLLSGFDVKYHDQTLLINGILKNAMPYFLNEKAILQASLRINSDSLDVNKLLATRNAEMQSSTAKSDTTILKSNLTSFAGLGNLNLEITMSAKYLAFDKYKLNDLKTTVKANAKQISLEKTSFNSVDASIKIPTALITPTNFSMTLDIDELDTQKLMKLIGDGAKTDSTNAEDETGALVDINYQLKGELDKELKPIFKSLSGYGLISVDRANIKGMKVFSHISKVADQGDNIHHNEIHDAMIITEIKGGKVHIKPFTVNLGKYVTSFEGTHSFENEINYFIKLGIPPFQKIKIPMHVTGTIDKPEVKISKKK